MDKYTWVYRGWVVNVRHNGFEDFTWGCRSVDGFVTGSVMIPPHSFPTKTQATDAAFKFIDDWCERNPDWDKPKTPDWDNPATPILSTDSPISAWFELSYAQFLTVPRLVLQSMPLAWQRKMADLLREMDDTFDWRPEEGRYWVKLRDGNGRFTDAPLSNYRRGSIEHLRKTKGDEYDDD